MWRYWDLLPVDTRDVVTIHEGFTPLFHAKRLGAALGLDNLWIKNDSVNPTYSFKDRVVSVALTRAKELGFDTVACASTGNLAGAVAAYGKVGGFRTFVFIPSDLEEGKIIGAGIYDPNLVAVDGNYDDVNRLCSEIADNYKWAFVNVNVRPYYAEGLQDPGIRGGGAAVWLAGAGPLRGPHRFGARLLTKIYKGLKEFYGSWASVPEKPFQMHAAQAEGCSPVVKAILGGGEVVPRQSPTPSPSHWPSATRRTATTPPSSSGRPAAGPPARHGTTKSWTGSKLSWPARKGPFHRDRRGCDCWRVEKAGRGW